MPTYDYKCPKCLNVFENFHGITESPEIKCPDCGTTSNRQISGGAGIMFKGTGFYVNDYKSAPSEKSSAAPKACASGGSCGCA